MRSLTHRPHLANLNEHNLQIAYRASAEPQNVLVEIKGNQNSSWEPDYAVRMRSHIWSINHGLGGSADFAPELCAAECLDGDVAADGEIHEQGPIFRWTLQLQAVSPDFWFVALDSLADGWNQGQSRIGGKMYENEPSLLPSQIRISSKLSPDKSPLSLTTLDFLKRLHASKQLYRRYPDMPFKLASVKGKPRLQVKVGKTTNEHQRLFQRLLHRISFTINEYVDREYIWTMSNVTATKTAYNVDWDNVDDLDDATLAIIENGLRWFHFKVTPILSAELRLP